MILRVMINSAEKGVVMITIEPLMDISSEDIRSVIGPYECREMYKINWFDSSDHTVMDLERVTLDEPWVGLYNHFDHETIEQYRKVLGYGFSLGAYDDKMLVGFLIAEPRSWNSSLWVWEFHVAPGRRRQGIGRLLMEAAVNRSIQLGLRIIVCETQNRNAPAIDTYRRLGFQVEGIDISYYTNEDYPDKGVAIFMKRRLP